MAEEAGGNEMESVKNYFDNAGFERWNKIYGTTSVRRAASLCRATSPASLRAPCVRSPASRARRACVPRACGWRADVETEAEIKPIINEEGITYAYISHNNLYLLAVTRTNVNAVSTLYFLHRLVDVFKFYFEARRAAHRGGVPGVTTSAARASDSVSRPRSRAQELDEESLRDNFVIGAPLAACAACALRFRPPAPRTALKRHVLQPMQRALCAPTVYELFDEVMDFGYPQFTEAKIMSDYIKTDAHKADVHEVKQSMAVTNAVSWRAEGIKYKARSRTQRARMSRTALRVALTRSSRAHVARCAEE